MTTFVAKATTIAAPCSNGNDKTSLLMGPAVLNLLDDNKFLNDWHQLCDSCPWGTAFQRPSFVATWYRVYEKEALPILIKTENEGRLTGLLTLAKDKSGLITGAGMSLAEYQVWLSTDAKDDTFIKNALAELRRTFPREKILLRYVPAGVSLDFTQKDPAWNKTCSVKQFAHPLMIINDAHLTAELKKKNRKEKMNRLKRLGELTFERITDYEAFAAVFDDLATQSDFRKGALYNKVVFKTNPLRKEALLALFQQKIVHATVLKLNNKIIASNVGISGNSQLHLQGINTIDAAYARYSPGIIHFLLLGKLLAEEQVPVFDLTPGGDSYKDALATDRTIAYALEISNNYDAFIGRLGTTGKGFFKKAAPIAGIKWETVKKGKRNLMLYRRKFRYAVRQGLPSLVTFFFNSIKKGDNSKKCWVIQKGFATSGLLKIQRDDLNDLLSFDQRDFRYVQQEFLAGAMKRIEEGAHCYSWAEDGRLLGCAWVAEMPAASIGEYKPDGETEGFYISFTGLYCHPNSRKQFSVFLKSVANELARDNPHDKLYLITDCNDDEVFEKAGFQQLM